MADSQKATPSLNKGNIFSPSISPAGASPSQIPAQSPDDPNNLTDQFATSLANNLIAQNPEGPRDIGDGTNAILRTPVAQDVLADFATSSAFKNLEVPDWNFEAAKRTVAVINDSSDAAVTSYASALNDIINTYFVKTDLQGIVSASGNSDTQKAAFVSSQVENALNAVSALSVPRDLSDFQKQFIKILIYQKNALALVNDAAVDPVRASLIFQAENENYIAALQSFQAAWEKAAQNKNFSFGRGPAEPEPPLVAFVNGALGIKKAHALFGLGDIVFDPAILARMVWDFVQQMLLQILKNTIITMLQNKVLSFIRNAGNPRFIQNWSGFLFGAYNVAAGSALGQIVPGLCNNFSSDVTSWLKNVFPTSPITTGGISLNGAAGTNCTLQSTVGNIPNYFSDFNAGGFGALGALTSPNNNPFGAFAQSYDTIQAVGAAAQDAAQSKAIAGSGYKGQEVCSDGSEPIGIAGACPDGSEPIVTTPGTTLADTVNRNVNSGIDLVVNANSITGVLATITSALLQQMITSGVNGLVGSLSSGTGAAPTPPPPSIPLSCIASPRLASTSNQVYFSATGGASSTVSYNWSVPGGNPAVGSGVTFSTAFFFPGSYTATVSEQGAATPQSATCQITIQ